MYYHCLFFQGLGVHKIAIRHVFWARCVRMQCSEMLILFYASAEPASSVLRNALGTHRFALVPAITPPSYPRAPAGPASPTTPQPYTPQKPQIINPNTLNPLDPSANPNPKPETLNPKPGLVDEVTLGGRQQGPLAIGATGTLSQVP